MEGVLKLVGLRWTLSDSVVGYQHFETDAKKKHKKGKRSKHSWKSSLNLIVIKVSAFHFLNPLLFEDLSSNSFFYN